MVGCTENGTEKCSSGGDEIMGMESFFVTVLTESLELSSIDGIRHVNGNSKSLKIHWSEILKDKFCVKLHNTYNLIINNCIEMKLEKTSNNSYYCILIGCFSCFEEGKRNMSNLIKQMSKCAGEQLKVDILGETNNFDEGKFHLLVNKAYNEKYIEFVKNYGKINLLVDPGNFYKEYKKLRNPLMRLLCKVKGFSNKKVTAKKN